MVLYLFNRLIAAKCALKKKKKNNVPLKKQKKKQKDVIY